jgi:predicted transglutaminase-like cysteine proteinase
MQSSLPWYSRHQGVVYFLNFSGDQAFSRRDAPIAIPHVWGEGLFCPKNRWLNWPRLLVLGFLGALLAVNAFDAPHLMRTAKSMGAEAEQRTQRLVDEMQSAAKSKEIDKLRAMNDFFNRSVAYEDDQYIWGRADYWTSPIELLNRGVGDCEDYALAKYFALISMGIAPAKLRMVYVRADVGGSVLAHMVLAYYPTANSEPFILDNLNGELLSASKRPDLAPVFSFNAQGLWQGVGMSSAGDPVARLSKWRDVLARAKSEGWW